MYWNFIRKVESGEVGVRGESLESKSVRKGVDEFGVWGRKLRELLREKCRRVNS